MPITPYPTNLLTYGNDPQFPGIGGNACHSGHMLCARGPDPAGHPSANDRWQAMTAVLRDPHAVTLRGEIDMLTCPGIRKALMEAIDSGNAHLIIDMSAVEFIDAGGIGVLVAARNRALAAGGSFALRTPSWAVRRILGLLDMDTLPVVS